MRRRFLNTGSSMSEARTKSIQVYIAAQSDPLASNRCRAIRLRSLAHGVGAGTTQSLVYIDAQGSTMELGSPEPDKSSLI